MGKIKDMKLIYCLTLPLLGLHKVSILFTKLFNSRWVGPKPNAWRGGEGVLYAIIGDRQIIPAQRPRMAWGLPHREGSGLLSADWLIRGDWYCPTTCKLEKAFKWNGNIIPHKGIPYNRGSSTIAKPTFLGRLKGHRGHSYMRITKKCHNFIVIWG